MSGKKYVQKFRKSWLDRDELREWLIENPNVEENPKYGGFCVYCGTALPSKLYDLQSHAASRKHARNVNEKARIESVEVKQVGMNVSGNLPDLCPKVSVTYKSDSVDTERAPVVEGKEDIFGKYIASELTLIKSQKIYEEVKWEILNALEKALNSQAEADETQS